MSTHAIADIDNDGFGEILLVSQNTSGSAARLLRAHGGLKWTSAVQVGYANLDESWVPQIADFDGNGTPEIRLGDQIFNSVNGALLASAAPAALVEQTLALPMSLRPPLTSCRADSAQTAMASNWLLATVSIPWTWLARP
ncbi:MAG: VCBS repeat-containing protein [Bacteroidia bacterium]